MYFIDEVYSDLFHKDRIIYLNDHITRANSTDIVAQMRYLEAQDPRSDITLLINAPGGEVTSGFFILDTMNAVRPDVATICGGSAGSFAAVLFCAGAYGKRGIYENAEVMFHTVSASYFGKEADIEVSATRTKNLNTRLLEIIAYNCGKTYEEVTRDVEHDFFLQAHDAISYGAADYIVKPRKKQQ